MEKFKILEKKFSEYIGTKRSVSVNTGTAALHVALEALKFEEGSEIIVPDYTMIATSWSIYYSRLKPVFVDCDDNLLINIEDIENKITQNTKAIMVTHIYGRVVDMDKIMNIAKKYNLRVIEDAAEAHGCEWNGKKVGSFDIGCFSFYKNKTIYGEEGGIITTNDENLANIIEDMKSMSFGKEHNYMHKQIGFNYRMTNTQAKLILKSLKNIEKNIIIRRNKQKLYDKLIDKKYHMPSRDVPWVYDVCIPNKDIIVNKLLEKGIAVRHGFKPNSICAPFNQELINNKTYEYSKKIMYFPLGENVKVKEIKNNVRIFYEILSEFG
jgi:dTDP-4-amino-4,6-dideoxygalactose transaminase